jgi:putative GTP pyrophosphokinase
MSAANRFMLNKKDFLKKYNIPLKKFQSARLDWDNLAAIYDNYTSVRNQLEPIASLFVESLRHVPEVHSLKARTKNPEHLIEKIIRKRIADKRRKIDLSNYQQEITDLIGVRALHLFKDDWLAIHKAITAMFSLRGDPVANIRKGDANAMIDVFTKEKWSVIEHEFGYRSIHYLAISQPGKDQYTVEIQVRTIFEEGWSEIDHKTRYPYDFENVLLTQYLVLFNRLAGSADEMGSFVKMLKDQLELRQGAHAAALAEKDKLIAELKAKVQSSQIQTSEKRSLVAGLDSLSKSTPSQSIISLHGRLADEKRADLLRAPDSLLFSKPDIANTAGLQAGLFAARRHWEPFASGSEHSLFSNADTRTTTDANERKRRGTTSAAKRRRSPRSKKVKRALTKRFV